MEKYSSGWRGCPAKALVRETVARVQIPPSPPKENCTRTQNEWRTFFVTEEYFGIVIPYTKKTLYKMFDKFNY